MCRNSRPEVFCEKGVLRNFTKFTGKHLCQSPEACNFIKKKILPQVFSCEFCESSKNTFYYRTPLVAAFAQVIIYSVLCKFSVDLADIKNFIGYSDSYRMVSYFIFHHFHVDGFKFRPTCSISIIKKRLLLQYIQFEIWFPDVFRGYRKGTSLA